MTDPDFEPKSPAIVTLGDPALRSPCRPVDELISPGQLRELSERMHAIMHQAAGVGVAGNQVGENVQVVVIADAAKPRGEKAREILTLQERVPIELYTLVNPVLNVHEDEGVARWFEGCLSIPGYTAIVPRYKVVDVAGFDLNGSPLRFVARGWHARILQHEIDHLHGIAYLDRMLSRTMMTKAHYAESWQGRPINEVIELLQAN